MNSHFIYQVLFLISGPTLQKIKNNGDTEGTEFKFKFQRSLASGGFTDILGEQTITGRTADLYQKQYEFDISGFAESQFPIAFKVKRTSDTDTDYMNGNDADGNPNNETFISHTSKFFVTSHTLIKNQESNQSGTYTHNNGSGGAGTLITITTAIFFLAGLLICWVLLFWKVILSWFKFCEDLIFLFWSVRFVLDCELSMIFGLLGFLS